MKSCDCPSRSLYFGGICSAHGTLAFEVMPNSIGVFLSDFCEHYSHTHFFDLIGYLGGGANDFFPLFEVETHGEGGAHREQLVGFNEHATEADVAGKGQ